MKKSREIAVFTISFIICAIFFCFLDKYIESRAMDQIARLELSGMNTLASELAVSFVTALGWTPILLALGLLVAAISKTLFKEWGNE